MKKQLESGLGALLASTQTNGDSTTQTKPSEAKRNPKTVCYSIDADLASRMKFIAGYERRNISEVVEEAFYHYIRSWQPEPVEMPSIDEIKDVKRSPSKGRK